MQKDLNVPSEVQVMERFYLFQEIFHAIIIIWTIKLLAAKLCVMTHYHIPEYHTLNKSLNCSLQDPGHNEGSTQYTVHFTQYFCVLTAGKICWLCQLNPCTDIDNNLAHNWGVGWGRGRLHRQQALLVHYFISWACLLISVILLTVWWKPKLKTEARS